MHSLSYTPLYSWHFVSFAFPQAFQNDGKPHDILCISSITVRKSLKVRSLSKSFNQMSTDNLFSFELVDAQKSFYLLKKCITHARITFYIFFSSSYIFILYRCFPEKNPYKYHFSLFPDFGDVTIIFYSQLQWEIPVFNKWLLFHKKLYLALSS